MGQERKDYQRDKECGYEIRRETKQNCEKEGEKRDIFENARKYFGKRDERVEKKVFEVVLCFMFGMLDVLDVLDVWDVEYWMLRMNLDKFR